MQRILWAIDASPTARVAQHLAARAVHALARATEAVVEPAYAAGLEGDGTGVDLGRDAIVKCVGEWLAGLDPRRVLPARFFVGSSARGTARALDVARHATATGADVVVSGHEGGGAVRHAFSGSLTDALIARSPVPVLAVGTESAPLPRFDRVLFPTDLSPLSEDGFAEALALARSLGARLSIYFKAPFWTEYFPAVTPLPALGIPPPAGYAAQSEMARRWLDEARAKGVSADAFLDDIPGAAADGILDRARRTRAPLLVMATHTGPLASVLLGSVTRHVLHHAPCPVWVIHPRAVRDVLRNAG